MKIFAHRGVSTHAPENTELAIRLAAEHQADGVEIDVFQHGHEFIVIHDTWLDRTTSGTGQIAEHSLAELRGLDAGTGQRVPLLSEVFGWLDKNCELNIEVKGCDDVSALLTYVDTHNLHLAADQLIYSSFNHHIVARVKTLNPKARIAGLTASIPLDYAAFAQKLNAEFVNVHIGVINPAMVADAKSRGLKVMVYTVDRPEELLQLREWGVDGVFANDPLAARNVLSAS